MPYPTQPNCYKCGKEKTDENTGKQDNGGSRGFRWICTECDCIRIREVNWGKLSEENLKEIYRKHRQNAQNIQKFIENKFGSTKPGPDSHGCPNCDYDRMSFFYSNQLLGYQYYCPKCWKNYRKQGNKLVLI